MTHAKQTNYQKPEKTDDLIRNERRGFRIHRTIYMIVIPGLFLINILVVPQYLWVFFPMAGWGFGLTMHYLFGVRRLAVKREQTQ